MYSYPRWIRYKKRIPGEWYATLNHLPTNPQTFNEPIIIMQLYGIVTEAWTDVNNLW